MSDSPDTEHYLSLDVKRPNACNHCGAVPNGTLMGAPMIVHKADCILCPQTPKEVVFATFVGSRRYTARDRVTGMLIEADEPDGPWYPVLNTEKPS